MSLLANLFRSAWARVAPRRDTGIASARLAEVSEQADGLGALSTEELLRIGRERLRAGDPVAAERHFDAAIERTPSSAEAQFYLGVALLRQKRYEDAIDSFVLALHYHPDLVEARFQLGLARLRLGQFADAIDCFRKVIELKPEHADARCNLGYVLHKHFEELEEAEAHLRRALELAPEKIETQTNLAMVLDYRGQSDAALQIYERILAAQPDDTEARVNRALILLARGDYANGWTNYEARHGLNARRDFGLPEWDGASLRGRAIIVHAEQGLGDEILFASCLPDLIAQADRVILECSERLEALFRRSFPRAIVRSGKKDGPIDWIEEYGPVDFQLPIGSLPRWFRRDRAAFSRAGAYLLADSRAVGEWRDRLAVGSKRVIGVSWRGGGPETRGRLRSVPLELLEPLLQQDAVFVSLQHGADVRELEGARAHIRAFPGVTDDPDELAALIGALDLVISVDNTTAQLAGALGHRVWIMLSASPEWRYGLSGDTMPWYPSARLFRQGGERRWEPVVQGIADALRK
jgi:tetratricopeptide (TPR) repeat protein